MNGWGDYYYYYSVKMSALLSEFASDRCLQPGDAESRRVFELLRCQSYFIHYVVLNKSFCYLLTYLLTYLHGSILFTYSSTNQELSLELTGY